MEWSKNSIVIISEKTLFYTASDPLILDENLENEPTILPPSGQLTPDQLADVVRIVEEVAADETLPFDEDSSDAGQRFYTNIDALQQGTKIRVEGYSQNDYFIALAIEIRL